MSFTKTVKTELRNAFGPQWVAGAAHLVIICVMLISAGFMVAEIFEIAKNAISADLESLAKNP